jgi:hypothetical protein
LIYIYCYDTSSCFESKKIYTGGINNSIYNNVSKLTPLGIKFITTFLFLRRIKKNLKIKKYDLSNEADKLEIYNALNIEVLNADRPSIILLYEFMNGFFVRQDQLNKINEIIHNYNNNESRIYQIGMGLGKTAVLGPLISLIYSQIYSKNIINIMPAHLISQANINYISNLSPFFPIKLREIKNYSKSYNPPKIDMIDNSFIYLMSDKTAKVIYLNSKIKSVYNNVKYPFLKMGDKNTADNIQYEQQLNTKIIDDGYLTSVLDNSVSLIDEIDSLSDSRKSELNYPIQDNKIPNNLIFRISHIMCLVKSINSIKVAEIKSSHINIIDNDLVCFNYTEEVEEFIIEKITACFNHLLLVNKFKEINISELIKRGEITYHDAVRDSSLNDFNEEQKYILKHIYHDNLPTCLKQIHKVNYGLKNDDFLNKCLNLEDPTFNLLAIPYESANKPSLESKFSDIDLTLFYTYYSFLKDKQLRNYDISKIIDLFKNKNQIESLIFNKLDTKALASVRTYLKLEIELSKFSNMFDSLKEYEKIDEEKRNQIKTTLVENDEFMTLYLYELMIDGNNLPSEFNDNISFIDIISSSFTKNRIGFSGTPSKLVPIDKNEDDDFALTKPRDNKSELYIKQPGAYKEYIESMFAIHPLQKGNTEKLNIYVYTDNPIDNLLIILNKNIHRCLIDVGALFKSDTPINIAQKIDTIKDLWRYTVFMDIVDENKKKYFDTGKILDYKKSTIFTDFIYYDNSNIVGTDIEQSETARGIITIGNNTTFTDFSQGLYRFRKLKDGQKADFMISIETYRQIFNTDLKLPAGIHTIEATPESLITICKYIIKNEEDVEKNNIFNFNIQNARVLYRNDNKSKIDCLDSVGDHLFKVRGFINEITNINTESFIKNDQRLSFNYKNIIGDYYTKIINYIDSKINNPKIKICIKNITDSSSKKVSVSIAESLSMSQSMQLSLAQSLSQSQYSKNSSSDYIKFEYYLDIAKINNNKTAIIDTTNIFEANYRAKILSEKMSLMYLIIKDGSNTYLTTNQTCNLFDSSSIKILTTGKAIDDSDVQFTGLGYAKLKNGKKPKNFKEVYELLKDFNFYNVSIIGNPSIKPPLPKIKDDIFKILRIDNFGKDILRMNPFNNIILNMNSINTEPKGINILPGGDLMYDGSDRFNEQKFKRYINEVLDVANLPKMLKIINYNKNGINNLEINNVENFGDDTLTQDPTILQIAGAKIVLYYSKYLKYKNKYNKLKLLLN